MIDRSRNIYFDNDDIITHFFYSYLYRIEIHSGDGGVDVEGCCRGYHIIVQCKNYRGSVGMVIFNSIIIIFFKIFELIYFF
jgi:hypothetical protein